MEEEGHTSTVSMLGFRSLLILLYISNTNKSKVGLEDMIKEGYSKAHSYLALCCMG